MRLESRFVLHASRRFPSLVVCGALLVAGLPRVALADGALPDSISILLPADQGQEILISTNFGLVVSEDFGATWTYVTEYTMNTPCAFLYQLGPSPNNRVYVESSSGISVSGDDGCSWDGGVFPVTNVSVQDAFPDPSDPLHVLALASWDGGPGGGAIDSVFESHDGASSFPNILLSVTSPVSLKSLEVAKSAATTYYATAYKNQGTTVLPMLFQSTNSGQTWQTYDLGTLGSAFAYILEVSPGNSNVLYLRVVSLADPSQGGLARVTVAADGGAAVSMLFNQGLDAFIQLSSGSLLLNSNNQDYISNDGTTFNRWGGCGGIRSFAERDGGLFALTDCSTVAVSWDLGVNWNALLESFEQISGPRACSSGGSCSLSSCSGCALTTSDCLTPGGVCGDWCCNEPRFNEAPQCTDNFGSCGPDGGSSSTAGGDSSSGSGSGGGSSVVDAGQPGGGGGCGCGESPAAAEDLLLFLLAVVLYSRRRSPT